MGTILPFIGAVLVLFLILKIIALPMKIIIKLLINALIGGIIIFILNLVGSNFGLTIDLNWITAIIVGILGIPGAILILVYEIFFK